VQVKRQKANIKSQNARRRNRRGVQVKRQNANVKSQNARRRNRRGVQVKRQNANVKSQNARRRKLRGVQVKRQKANIKMQNGPRRKLRAVAMAISVLGPESDTESDVCACTFGPAWQRPLPVGCCHSEERSDEESRLSAVQSLSRLAEAARFLTPFGMTGGNWFNVGSGAGARRFSS